MTFEQISNMDLTCSRRRKSWSDSYRTKFTPFFPCSDYDSIPTATLTPTFQHQLDLMQQKIDILNDEVKTLKQALSDKSTTIDLTPFPNNKTHERSSTCSPCFSNVAVSDGNICITVPNEKENYHQCTSNVDSIENNTDFNNQSNLYNTKGIFIHAILFICRYETGGVSSWLAAIGSFFFCTFQIFMISTMWEDSYGRFNSREETEICESFHYRSIIILFLTCILFACFLRKDVKESVMEETILNHVVSQRKESISSLRAIEVIRLCLRIRQFLLPCYIAQTAILLVFSENSISANEIFLDFLSFSFIAEADNLLGGFLFTKSDNIKADKIIEDIIANCDEEKNQHFSSSFLWSQMLAVVPTMAVTFTAVVLKQRRNCFNNLAVFYRLYAPGVFPLGMITACSIIGFVLERRKITLFGRYINSLAELLVNWAAFLVYLIIVMIANIKGFNLSTRKMGIGIALLFLFIFMWLRDYYRRHVNSEENTRRHVVFSIFSSVIVIAANSIAMYIALADSENFKRHSI